MNVTHCPLSELPALLRGKSFHLLVSASYEDRALAVWRTLQPAALGERYICFNQNHAEYLEGRVKIFKELDANATVVPLDSDQPLRTFSALRIIVESLAERGPCTLVVDVTGFTREALAILIYLATQRLVVPGSTLSVVYHKAKAYGRTATGGWLSQGVRDVRTILGYSGIIHLAAQTHLILLPGFEFERAHEIIDALQPNRISFGEVSSEDSVSGDFHGALKEFVARSEAFYSGISFDRTRFSSIDPFVTRDHIIECAKASSGNVVVACLNSKPAMVGACLAALDQRNIQIVYAQPLCYNVQDYSVSSGSALSFDISVGQE